MKKHIKPVVAAAVLAAGLIAAGCRLVFFKGAPAKAELLASVPEISTKTYNRFVFTLSIDAAGADGNGETFTDAGALELCGDVSHMYNQDINFKASGYKAHAESWTDFKTKEHYRDLGDGGGWATGEIMADDAVTRLVSVVNERDLDPVLTMTDSACTLSWKFDTDLDYLFAKLLSSYTEDLTLSGHGRATAVFDPETYEFEYFTFVISASNPEGAGAVLDSVFYWEEKNNEKKTLAIPGDVISEAHANSTGIIVNGGWDLEVGPMAESLTLEYGGSAETTKDSSSSSLFWTVKKDGISAAVNYRKAKDAASRYEEGSTFLTSLYGGCAEEADDGSYFYDSASGCLAYIAKGGDWYAEIIITGQPGTSQGDLRKPLITYKAKLGI